MKARYVILAIVAVAILMSIISVAAGDVGPSDDRLTLGSPIRDTPAPIWRPGGWVPVAPECDNIREIYGGWIPANLPFNCGLSME
jgi:hypothetical protein